jgi:hypothetical protein
MARTSRMVLNREALHELDLGMARGLERVAFEVLDRADVPDAPTFGEGLIGSGGWTSYVDGKKVGGTVERKPKSFKVRGRGVSVAAGYPSPARFNEMGTVHQPARPFLAPAVVAVVGDGGVVQGAIKVALADVLGAKQRKAARLAKYGPGIPSGRSVPARAVGHPVDFADFLDLNVPLGTTK